MKRKKDSENRYRLRDDGSLSWLFFHTVRKLRHNGAYGYSQQRVLSMLDDMGPLSQKKVQEILDIQAGSLSELCAKLEDRGLVRRSRDENDKRNVVLSITEEGRNKRREILAHKDEVMFKALSEEERNQLRNILNKLSAGISDRKEIDFINNEQSGGGKEK